MDLTQYATLEDTNKTSQNEKVTADLLQKKLSDVDSMAKAEGKEKRQDEGAEGETTSVTLNAKRSCEDLDDGTDESSAMKRSKTVSTSVGRVGQDSYEVVEEDEQVEPALQKLRECAEDCPLLAVDLEGEKLRRDGQLVVMSVATKSDTFLFNIKKLGTGVFDKGLRDLLQDADRQKVMFDCRQDSDCLWHQFQVKLANVLDLQLMEVIYRNDHTKHSRILMMNTNRASQFFPKVKGFKKCFESYCYQDRGILQAKELGSQVMKREGVWLEQPLQKALLDYSAADVIGFFKLYEKLKSVLHLSENEVVAASENYLEFHRSRDVRTNDNFERNGFVPWRTFPTTPGTGPSTTCQKCKKDFPRSDFEQSPRGRRVCLVCMKIQGEMNKGYY